MWTAECMKKLEIKDDPKKGRGVYSGEIIRRGQIIERCELIVLSLKDIHGVLEGYVYHFKKGHAALALGNGSLYNHSDDPNAIFTLNTILRTVTIKARRNITFGEEITLDYGYGTKLKKKFNIS
jgi:uncharacterized protein